MLFTNMWELMLWYGSYGGLLAQPLAHLVHPVQECCIVVLDWASAYTAALELGGQLF